VVHVPLVLTRAEAQAVLARLHGAPWLMGALMYGAGLRVLECIWAGTLKPKRRSEVERI
jgi:predicted 2-oxoglutarate/Fe(II)-dependent dioxygenase YbiX